MSQQMSCIILSIIWALYFKVLNFCLLFPEIILKFLTLNFLLLRIVKTKLEGGPFGPKRVAPIFNRMLLYKKYTRV